MRELLTDNYVQNEAIINLQPKRGKPRKLNSNQREGNNPSLRDVRMMGLGT